MAIAVTSLGSGAVTAPPRKRVETPYPVLSASQIKTFDAASDGGCARKWAFERLLKLETPQGAAAALGDDVDTGQLQPYLMEGRALDLSRPSGRIAETSLPLIPAPKTPGLVCQQHFVMPTFTGPGAGTDSARFGYQGYLDMFAPTSECVPGIAPISASTSIWWPPFVGDFKTTSNPRYIKTPEDLRTDVQATLYAKWATWAFDANQVDLIWVYMLTKGEPRAERSPLRAQLADINERFAEIEAVANVMFDARLSAPAYQQVLADLVDRDDPETKTEEWASLRTTRNQARLAANRPLLKYVESLEPNTDSCWSFGGCPHRAYCPKPKANTADAVALENLLQDLETPTNPMTTEAPKNKFYDKLNQKKAALEAGVAPAPAPAPTAGVNPPEVNLPPADPIGSVPASMTVATTATTAPAPAATADAPKAKGRPKGSKNKPKEDPTPALATAPAPAADKPLIEIVTFGSNKAPSEEGMTFPCTWPEMTFTSYGAGYRVGPFTKTGIIRKGESYELAHEREYSELEAMAKLYIRRQKAFYDTHVTDSPADQKKAA